MPTAASRSLMPLGSSEAMMGMMETSARPATPMELLREAARTPATEVPCQPMGEVSVLELLKFQPPTKWPARSGWVESMPLSMTATMMEREPPLMDQADSELICWWWQELG